MNILSVMLVSLGFLSALLIALLVAPAYRRRAVRLTTEEIRRSMPVTEAEIRADKDRLRADYAVRLHEFEQKLEHASLDAARQSVEINRRDASISGLEGEIGELKTSLEEHENARRVLEHTVMERLPKVEQRLAEAKKLLFQRDREILTLTQSAEKQNRALDEATQINTQQRDEIHRLNAAITTRAARNREGLGDPRFDGEVALRSEIEALRAKTRDQANLITRMQTLLVRAGVAPDGVGKAADAVGAMDAGDGEMARLKNDLAEAKNALKAAGARTASGDRSSAGASAEPALRALKSENRDQAAEIARLKAALATFETGEDAERAGGKDSKIAMKARLASLEAENQQQTVTIQSLRAEVAGTNERLARQAAHFRDEMRRLGVGTLPTTGDPRMAAQAAAQEATPQRRSLSDRINEPRARIAAGQTAANGDDVKSSDALPATPAMAKPRAPGITPLSARIEAVAQNSQNGSNGASASSDVVESAPAPDARPRRSRLLERLTGTSKSAT